MAKEKLKPSKTPAVPTKTVREPKPEIPAVKHKLTTFKPQREYVWEVPADFTPFFLEVIFRTDDDGMLNLHNEFKVNHHKGRYDDDEKKKRDMWEYDPTTVASIFTRLGMATYHATGKISVSKAGVSTPKRLEPNTVYKLVYRIQAKQNSFAEDPKSAAKILGAALQKVWMSVRVKDKTTGKVKRKAVELGRKDPYFRMLLRANKFLPPAFKAVLQPPKRSRRKADDEGDE